MKLSMLGCLLWAASCVSLFAQPLLTDEWKGGTWSAQPARFSFTESNGSQAKAIGARSTATLRLTKMLDVSVSGSISKLGKSLTTEIGVTKRLPWLDLGVRVMGAADVGSEYSSRIPNATNYRGGVALYRDGVFEVSESLLIKPIAGVQFDGGSWQSYVIENDTWKKNGRSTLSGFLGFFGVPVVYSFKERFYAFVTPSVSYPRTSRRPLHAFVFGEQPIGIGVKF